MPDPYGLFPDLEIVWHLCLPFGPSKYRTSAASPHVVPQMPLQTAPKRDAFPWVKQHRTGRVAHRVDDVKNDSGLARLRTRLCRIPCLSMDETDQVRMLIARNRRLRAQALEARLRAQEVIAKSQQAVQTTMRAMRMAEQWPQWLASAQNFWRAKTKAFGVRVHSWNKQSASPLSRRLCLALPKAKRQRSGCY
jgi:hypothetical protein